MDKYPSDPQTNFQKLSTLLVTVKERRQRLVPLCVSGQPFSGWNRSCSVTSWEVFHPVRRILITDDHADYRFLLRYRVQKLGPFEIVEASDGPQALAIATHTPLALI